MSDYLILQNIQQHITLNDTELQYFQSKLKFSSIQRKDLILRQEQICKKLFFVEKGSFRAYNINEEGKESTIMFALKNWWITDMDCFVNQKPAQVSIEALEQSTVISLSFGALHDLYEKIPAFERLFRILFQNAYIREQKRTLLYLSSNTQERYYQFLKQYPDFIEKVTQKQIASYLGVTPEFLSAVKKK